MKIRAAITERQEPPATFTIQEVDIVEPRDNEVRVKIVGAGICHTDIAYATNEFNVPVPMPMVMGHEGAGIVESVGSGVTKVKVGDHVVISNPSCGACDACNSGQEWFCEKSADLSLLAGGKDFFGTTPLSRNGEPVYILFQQSSFAEYVVTNQRCITKIPKEMDLKIAGPLGCGLRTGSGAVQSILKPKIGEWVLINGAGAVGLSGLWMAKALGAKVCVADISDNRLKMAKDTGADAVVNTKGLSEEEVVNAIRIATNGGAHHMVEGSGNIPAIKAGMLALRPGGKVAQAGVGGEMKLDSWFFGPVDCKQITWVRMGNIANDEIIPMLCELYMAGKFPFDKLITFYKFDDIQKAIDDNIAGKNIKPVLLFD